MPERPLPYSRQWIGDEEIAAAMEVLRSDWITQGPKVGEFETAVASFVGTPHAVAVGSGTAALHLSCLAAGFAPGDEVVVSPLTFVATANAVLYAGATPAFADVRDSDGCLDPQAALARIGPRTRGILGVDFAGHPCDWDSLREIARDRQLVLVDDACHALGAEHRGRRIGTQADFTAFSFHPVKHVTTGEGGLIAVSDPERARHLAVLRSHGVERERFVEEGEDHGPWYYEMQHLGHNFRITDIQCAVGIVQMKRLGEFLARRRRLADLYGERLGGLGGVRVPADSEWGRSAWHLYVVRVPRESRRSIFCALRERGIGAQVHYLPVHLHPYYRRRFGTGRGDFPVAERIYDESISLPLFPAMADSDVDSVVLALREAMSANYRASSRT
ncbi:MAG: UDP-4-amino-4,6-dideoxy-N-acetyl-beta-L-altrosamine transaminase [Planctomycetes bacterium]|nr:UDP-4-amino-4,6-dideoxy-N-acetyl-beta-L-altrosamine transaminase [Planctomycetota bacterium]